MGIRREFNKTGQIWSFQASTGSFVVSSGWRLDREFPSFIELFHLDIAALPSQEERKNNNKKRPCMAPQHKSHLAPSVPMLSWPLNLDFSKAYGILWASQLKIIPERAISDPAQVRCSEKGKCQKLKHQNRIKKKSRNCKQRVRLDQPQAWAETVYWHETKGGNRC
jgi:hypothetical protein